jgi:hypothetical protein
MVGMPVRHVRAAALVEPLEDTRMDATTATAEARGPAEVISMVDKVQKPVKQPKPQPKPREGTAPVTKGEDGEAPPPVVERRQGERRGGEYDRQTGPSSRRPSAWHSRPGR